MADRFTAAFLNGEIQKRRYCEFPGEHRSLFRQSLPAAPPQRGGVASYGHETENREPTRLRIRIELFSVGLSNYFNRAMICSVIALMAASASGSKPVVGDAAGGTWHVTPGRHSGLSHSSHSFMP